MSREFSSPILTTNVPAGTDAAAARHAVVIGGSMAGLLAARVLADSFERVTVIERDSLPAAPTPRKGVPQSRHVHVLMLRGRMILEDLFPGLSDEMISAGAATVDVADDLAWLTPRGWGLRFNSSLMLLTFTRDLLDWHVRRRLSETATVRILDGGEVINLIPDASTGGVAGVRVLWRRGGSSGGGSNGGGQQSVAVEQEELRADLVVDATGRGSRAPELLRALGYAPPAETVISAALGYASRLYRRPAAASAAPDGWKAVFIQAAPPEQTRAGILFPVEGDRWLVTLGGGGGDYPPTDEVGFNEFARSLPTPLLYELISGAEPLTPIYSYRATENRLRHFEQLSRWPENFVVIGDAACAFNPVYGQGMTNAALSALTLGEVLREHRRRFADGRLTGMARRFQRRLARVNRAPWLLATGEDYRYRETTGGAPDFSTRLMHAYMDGVVELSTARAGVRRVLLEVFHMLRPPAALFHPAILFRVLWGVINSMFERKETPALPRALGDTAT